MVRVAKMDRQQVETVFNLLPDSHYNPVYIMGNTDEVIEMFSLRCKNYFGFSVTDINTAPITQCDCCIIKNFEEIESMPALQDKVADFLGNCILKGTQIVIISKKGINSMKLDGRLRSRVCSGVIIEP